MHEKSIKLLNKAVGDELSAVHQYMYWHFHCDDQGFDLLAQLYQRTAIEEMIHVEKLAERVLFLKGDVDMTVTDPVKPITDVQKMLETAAAMEEQSALDYNKWANECSQNADAMSKHPNVHGDDIIPYGIEENIWQGMEDLFRESPATRNLVKTGKVKAIRFTTLAAICAELGCQPGDILEYVVPAPK